MADKSYDVVIVGGGNKCLVTAMYLTKYGGLSVGIFEERHELGAGWSSEEPSPGFVGNTCSNNHYAYYQTCTYWDFPEFKDYGARYMLTPSATGVAFSDDTCFLQYSAFPEVDPAQERTAENISKFSKKDADTYLWLWNKAMTHWFPAMLEWIFNPAKPMGEPDAIDKLMMNRDCGIDPVWMLMNCTQLFTSIFEDPHLQVAFLRIVQSFGVATDEPGSGFSALIMTFLSQAFQCYVSGGTHALTHAAYRVIHENGGEVWTNSKVDKIIIENDRAKGIRLANGTEVEARVAVATNVDPYQLVFELIGPEKLDPIIARKVKHLVRDFIAIAWYSWAFTERPQWKCEQFESWAKHCGWMCFGGTAELDVNTFARETCERRAGIWPTELNLGISYMGVNDIENFDQCMAPPDVGFKILTEQFVLPAWRLSDEEWKKRERQHAEESIEIINQYAPNITWDSVSGYLPVTPYYTANLARNFAPGGNYSVIDQTPAQAGRFRPTTELAGNRVPGIKGLYCTGGAWHPFAGGHSANGYNCYKVMAEDLSLKKPWENRPF